MSSQTQSRYIADLTVLKTKEFKEVKEILLANAIVSENADVINSATTIAEITAALTDMQASKFIDVLVKLKEPARDNSYSRRRVEKITSILEEINNEIDSWDFE